MAPYTPPHWERPPTLVSTPPPAQPRLHLPPPSLQSPPQNLQSPPQNLQSPPQNLQSPPQNTQVSQNDQSISPHLQYGSPRHQLKYQKIQLPPPDLQLPPPDLQLPPPNHMLPPPSIKMIQLPLPNLKFPPPTFEISPPNVKVPPPARKISLPNLKVPPPSCMVSSLNIKVLPPTCMMSPPNIKMPSTTHKMSPPTLQMAHTNLNVPPPALRMVAPTLTVPPPSINETSPSCKKAPANLQLLPLNIQLPPLNIQLPPPNLQLPPENFQLPPNPLPSCHISPIVPPNCSQPPPTVITNSLPVVSIPFQQLYDSARVQDICSVTEQHADRHTFRPHSQIKVHNGIESKRNGHIESQARTSRTDWRYKHRSQSVSSDNRRSSYKRKRSDEKSYKEPRASSFERGWHRGGDSCNHNERTCCLRYCDTMSPLRAFDTRSDENSNIVKKTSNGEREYKYPEEEKEGSPAPCSSHAQLYYDAGEAEGGGGGGRAVRGTQHLAELCDRFERDLLLSGRCQREEPPPSHDAQRRTCTSCSESEESEEELACDPAHALEVLRRKMAHPRRLHPHIWYNEEGEANGGPTCVCTADARLQGVHHYVYEGEPKYPRCTPDANNIDKLFYYRVTVSPTTNFLLETPTVITRDRRDYIFTGFSLISHYELKELPPCKITRCKIEHTIHYLKGEAPANFTIRELDLFHSYLFKELLQLMDFNDKSTDETCSQFHVLPRFVTQMAGGCEVLSMCEVMKYLLNSNIPVLEYNQKHPEDGCREALLRNPDKKPACIRCDRLDRHELRPPAAAPGEAAPPPLYPTIVHFGLKPAQLCFTLNKEYREAWKMSKNYYHKVTSMAKPTEEDMRLLRKANQRLSEVKRSTMVKRDFTAVLSSEGFYTTGLMSDIVQHALLIPKLTHHLRFYKSLESLESKLCYKFARPSLLRAALTHPAYRDHGTNPDHERNIITNCALSRPTYGDVSNDLCPSRRRGIKNLARKMDVRGAEAEAAPDNNYERLEFLGDAVLQLLTSYHLFLMLPDMDEGELSERRSAIVNNANLAVVGKDLGLDKYILMRHNVDNSEEYVMSRITSNCVEAVLGAVYIDGGLQAADKTCAEIIWGDSHYKEPWMKERVHPLVSEEPRGDRHYIPLYTNLQKLVLFEESICLEFKHIRLLARAFADRTQSESYLTLGSGQRLEFFGDAVLELVVSAKLFRRFPDHTEGPLSLLRGSLVNNNMLAVVFDDLDMGSYTISTLPGSKPYCLKQKADVVEAFLGAVYLDKGMTYCESIIEVVLMHRLDSILQNQSWNDSKSKLQHCCIALRTIDSDPEMPVYRLLERHGASHEAKYVVGVYLRGERLATGSGNSIGRAEAAAATAALMDRLDLFPLLDLYGRIMQRPMMRDQTSETNKNIKPTPSSSCSGQELHVSCQERHIRNLESHVSSQESHVSSQESLVSSQESLVSSQQSHFNGQEHKTETENSLKSETNSESDDSLDNITVTTWLTDMLHLKEKMIDNKTYDRLIAKKNYCSDDDHD